LEDIPPKADPVLFILTSIEDLKKASSIAYRCEAQDFMPLQN
jgi:hypothetical protein